jgi:hypothetical protein
MGRLALEIGVKAGLNTETVPAMAIGVLIENRPDDDELDFADRLIHPIEEGQLPGNSP